MNQPVARKTFRQWTKSKSLNNSAYDFHASSGTRICLPMYVDPPITLERSG